MTGYASRMKEPLISILLCNRTGRLMEHTKIKNRKKQKTIIF